MRRSVALGLFVLLFVDCAPRAASAGPLRIGASFEWGRSELDSRFGGSLWLIVPLERLASPVRASRFASPLAEEGPARTKRPVRAAQTPIADLRLARGALRAARRASARETAERRLDGLGSRARVSAALPELMLRATRSTDQSLRLSPDDRDVTVYDYTRTGGADLLLEARATWNLDRLVFADEELGVERLRLEHAKSDERLLERVLALLVLWERSRRTLAAPETEPELRLRAEVEQLQAEAGLDALTAGWFGAELERGAVRGLPPAPVQLPPEAPDGAAPAPPQKAP